MDFSNLIAISVDDNQKNLELTEQLASEIGIKIKTFLDPQTALEFCRTEKIDIAFIDYKMPKMTGIELISQLRPYHPDIPIIMVTAVHEVADLKIDAIKAGATDFIHKPIDVDEFIARTQNLAQLRIYQLIHKENEEKLKEDVSTAIKQIEQRDLETLDVLGLAAEYKDHDTSLHIFRVAELSRLLAKRAGLDKKEQDIIYYAAPLHDVGKIGIPDSILLKPGRLTQEEKKTMEQHTIMGYKLLANRQSPYLQAGAIIALNHHERYNGTGYPQGIAGEDIPFLGRIVALVDVVDALATKRPYKDPWPRDKIINLVQEEKGEHFDPQLVDLLLNEVVEIFDKYYLQTEGIFLS